MFIESQSRRWMMACCALAVFSTFVAVVFVQRNFVYDDSFISYRYAQNLAQGNGLTWNIGEKPVEGYTNFLLVVVLAPFLALGFDPLWVTRLLSVAAALGICGLCVAMARPLCRHKETAICAGLAFLPIGSTFLLTTVGLETVIYTFFLFLSFFYAREVLQGKERAVLFFGFSQFLAFLLRPEAPLLTLLFVAVVFLRRRDRLQTVLRPLIFSLVLPIVLYLIWKQIHFGTIVPNPFFIKVGGGRFPDPRGVQSVVTYLLVSVKLLALVVATVWMMRYTERKKIDTISLKNRELETRLLTTWLILAYLLFYLRVETLMDIYHRFLYPVTPFLFYLALPLICFIIEKLSAWKVSVWLRVPVGLAIYGFLFFQDPLASAQTVVDALRGKDANSNPSDIMQKEYSIAHRLQNFPDVRQLTIAWGDAGVIPYFTQAKVVDVVGLNDHFIARERNLNRLTSYLFSRNPDLFLLPGQSDNQWIAYGHGPLGNYRLWTSDVRWRNYEYAGTSNTNIYNIHYFVRTDSRYRASLKRFIERSVADRVLRPFPLPMNLRPVK